MTKHPIGDIICLIFSQGVFFMSIERVRNYLAQYGMENEIKEFNVSSATVALAAQALGCSEAHIAKTLSFNVNGKNVLIVTAGDAKVNNGKFKHFFNVKASMLPACEVEEKIGHGVGGVCPFGVNEDVEIYLDDSLKRFETVFPACGSSNSAIELTLPLLEKLAKPVSWVDVCKIPEE